MLNVKNSHLPSTPAEVLEISIFRKLRMKVVLSLVKLFRLWRSPLENAATDLAEMKWLDGCYWVHKSIHPVMKPENRSHVGGIFLINSETVKLPQGFKKNSSITFGACGDILYPQSGNNETSTIGIENSQDIIFEDVANLLFERTISLVNLESPITTQALKQEIISNKEPPVECCSQTQFDFIKGHKGKNFTVVNTANNHIFDMGIEGLETTNRALAEAGMLNIGMNSNRAEFGKAKVIIRENIKVGFVSVTFGLNGRKLPTSEEFRINKCRILSKFVDAELDLLKIQIEDCKKNECDFIIGYLHWGYEFEFYPRIKQVKTAHTLAELGIDAIVSSHSHVIQPVEYYHTKRDPNRIAVIAYSLGSIIWGYQAPHLVLSLILNFTLSKGSLGDKILTYIEKVDVTPVFRVTSINNGKMQTRIKRLSGVGQKDLNLSKDYITAIQRYASLVSSIVILYFNYHLVAFRVQNL